ncbi:hypothetical protein FGO68_gene2465 [Halteria grandinella]|uniref:Uncharacterized protein n=1 Tax=Halteria grandinella TaxID=5974 RepID=A0A8J8T295_HALGN|nr:hypothetical protein FGO68_gene2465 [Halteria grandinella]
MYEIIAYIGVVLFSTGILVWMSYQLGNNHSFAVGHVIWQETKYWEVGSMVDIAAVQKGATCPDGYDAIKGIFPGTREYCTPYFNSAPFMVGKCKANRVSGSNHDGIPMTSLSYINNQTICIKRDSSINYHYIAQKRTTKFKPNCDQFSQKCGGNSDHSFCISKGNIGNYKTCPVNQLDFSNSLESLPASLTNESTKPLLNSYTAHLTTQGTSSPIVNLLFLLSRPCAIEWQSYSRRQQEVHLIYKVDNCEFQENWSKEHLLYTSTKMREVEYSVYEENQLIKSIGEHVPHYAKEELMLNEYHIYYKTYSLWKSECQSVYTTEQVADAFANSSKLALDTDQIWTFSIILLIGSIVVINISLRVPSLFLVMPGFFLLMLVLIIVYLFSALNDTNSINLTILDYAVANNCSDSVLQLSFERLQRELGAVKGRIVIALIFAFLDVGLMIAPVCYMLVKKMNEERRAMSTQQVVSSDTLLNRGDAPVGRVSIPLMRINRPPESDYDGARKNERDPFR